MGSLRGLAVATLAVLGPALAGCVGLSPSPELLGEPFPQGIPAPQWQTGHSWTYRVEQTWNLAWDGGHQEQMREEFVSTVTVLGRGGVTQRSGTPLDTYDYYVVRIDPPMGPPYFGPAGASFLALRTLDLAARSATNATQPLHPPLPEGVETTSRLRPTCELAVWDNAPFRAVNLRFPLEFQDTVRWDPDTPGLHPEFRVHGLFARGLGNETVEAVYVETGAHADGPLPPAPVVRRFAELPDRVHAVSAFDAEGGLY